MSNYIETMAKICHFYFPAFSFSMRRRFSPPVGSNITFLAFWVAHSFVLLFRHFIAVRRFREIHCGYTKRMLFFLLRFFSYKESRQRAMLSWILLGDIFFEESIIRIFFGTSLYVIQRARLALFRQLHG